MKPMTFLPRVSALCALGALASVASAQNSQGLKGHYVILSATKVVESSTAGSASLIVTAPAATFSTSTRTWTQNLSASNSSTYANAAALGTALDGTAEHQVSYTVRVLWVPDPDNPAGLKPVGQVAEWSGSASTSAQIGFLVQIPKFGPPPVGAWGNFMSYNFVDLGGTAMNTTLNNLDSTRSSSSNFTNLADGGFEFSDQAEGWVGTCTFTHINHVSWDTSCNANCKAWGAGSSANMSRTLNRIGGLPVQ